MFICSNNNSPQNNSSLIKIGLYIFGLNCNNIKNSVRNNNNDDNKNVIFFIIHNNNNNTQ